MSHSFCEEITDSECIPGPDFELQLPSDDAPLAVLGMAKFLAYNRGDGEPDDEHPFEGLEVFVLASPPDENGNQVLFLMGPGLQVTGRGIEG
jgi:hypothetical protein